MELPQTFSINHQELHRDRRDKPPTPLTQEHYPPLPELGKCMCNAYHPRGPCPANRGHRLAQLAQPCTDLQAGACVRGRNGLQDKNTAERGRVREFIVKPSCHIKELSLHLCSVQARVPCPHFTQFQVIVSTLTGQECVGFRYISTLFGENCLSPCLSQCMSWPEFMTDDQGVCHKE